MECSTAELACIYSALILYDDDVSITEDKLVALIKAAGVHVEPFWPSLYAKALGNVNLGALITNVAGGMATGAPPAPSAETAPAATEAPGTGYTKTKYIVN
uniref:large ribosomal subunit protein P1-like n=1 Tax=Myxine glutinosa TaxID=7769 RepID=UPI00358F3EAC